MLRQHGRDAVRRGDGRRYDQTAQGPGWFWKDYNYEARVRYTSKIWRSYFTWKYFYEIISNVNYILSVEHTAAGDEND